MMGYGDKFQDKYPGLYASWNDMKRRCESRDRAEYKNYGGRGIGYPESWKLFESFFCDMKSGWENGLTLDRIDNEKSYSKENCRWANRIIQNNNSRKNRFIEFMGLRMTLSQWARHLNIKRSTLAQRFYVYGWNVERCLGR